MVRVEYKAIQNLKGLKKENLRDNMSTLELVLNMLAEATTTELAKIGASVLRSAAWQPLEKGLNWRGVQFSQCKQDAYADAVFP